MSQVVLYDPSGETTAPILNLVLLEITQFKAVVSMFGLQPIYPLELINEAQRIINEIVTTGSSTRPLLGVYFDNTYTGKGAKISGLTNGDAASTAGIAVGSIITSIDGKKVSDFVSAIVRIRSHAPGDRISLTVTLPTGGNKSYSLTLGSATSN